MPWVKIPKEHHAVLEAALPDDERIEVKAMFGGLAAMLNGRMMAGLFGTSAIVRLGPADYASLLASGGEPFDPMSNGRTMAETLVLPQREFDDRARLAAWLLRARDHVAALPAPKAKRKAASEATTSAAARKKGATKKRA